MPRYYTTQRPLAPGAIPRLRIPVGFEAWPERRYVPEIDRRAEFWDGVRGFLEKRRAKGQEERNEEAGLCERHHPSRCVVLD